MTSKSHNQNPKIDYAELLIRFKRGENKLEKARETNRNLGLSKGFMDNYVFNKDISSEMRLKTTSGSCKN